MNFDVVELRDAIAGKKVMVIGEAILDCYLKGTSDRLCPEAPVPVVNISEICRVPGGAANTAVNVRDLGGDVTFISVVGDDCEGTLLRQVLGSDLAVTDIHIQPGRQTLSKHRVVAATQILVRFDQGTTTAVDAKTEQILIARLEALFHRCDAVIVSDYGYGIITPAIIAAIAQLQQASPRTLVIDSKHLAAFRDVGVTAVKPNYREATQLLGIEQLAATADDTRADQIAAYRQQLLALTNAKIVAVTLDAAGAIIFEHSGDVIHRSTSNQAQTSRATGAGDTYVSALTLALAANVAVQVASEFAAAAAEIVVQKDGTTTCSIAELQQKYATLPNENQKYVNCNELSALVAKHRAARRRIVFTNGCFDLLHAGHVAYLSQAKALGDLLIIGVNSDASVRRLKGSTRPINTLGDRLKVLAALGCVDYLVAFDEDTPIALLPLVCPDIYVKGGDYTKETLPETAIVEQLGGEVRILPFVEHCSTTYTIEQICQRHSSKNAP